MILDALPHEPPTTGPYAYNTWGPTAAGFPAAGQTYVDPVFNETVRRLTAEYPNPSYSDHYIKNGFWNADGTRFYQRVGGGQAVILNTTTGAVVRSGLPEVGANGGDISFDPVDPDIYYYRSGTQLRRYRLSTGTTELVKDFGALLGGMGGSPTWLSRTGRWMVQNVGGVVRIYDQQAGVLYAGAITDPFDQLGISPDGNYVIIDNAYTHKSYLINHVTQTVATTGVLFWTLGGTHSNVLTATDGKTYSIVWNDSGAPNGIYRVDVTLNQSGRTLAQQTADNLCLVDFDVRGSHTSTVWRGPFINWAFISQENNDGIGVFPGQAGWFPYKSELLAVEVLTGEIRRFVHARARGTNYYGGQPKPSVMWDGSKVSWQSNFNAPQAGYGDIYILENVSLGGGADTTPPAVPATPTLVSAIFT